MLDLMDLILEINELKKSNIGGEVEKRLKEFLDFRKRTNDEWFSELCFCILTANSKARTALNIQKEMGEEGFRNWSEEDIRNCIRINKHRFHNNKAKYIVLAREHINIKPKIKKIIEENGEKEAREWLVKNIKGLGYKEASHFLRNTGHFDVAILDRHILNLMIENGYLTEKPKSLNKKNYSEIEASFNEIAKEADMSLGELDLYMWFMKGGEVLK